MCASTAKIAFLGNPKTICGSWSRNGTDASGRLDYFMKFTIEAEMKDRWVPHFLSMLKYMQQLGGLGSSRTVAIYADGDGDFRPKFKWDDALSSDAKPIKDDKGDRIYDAG